MATKTDCIDGTGSIVTKTISVTDFNSINLAIAASVTITQGATQQVEVTGQDNVINGIETSVSNGLWIIEFDECYNYTSLAINITVPDLTKVTTSASGTVVVNNFTGQSNSFNVSITGSGDITLNEFDGITDLTAKIPGSGDVTANADISIQNLSVNISGSGKYNGFSISSDDCTAKISGSGKIETTVQNNLNVTISGSGDVYYKGSPTITQKITGSGKIVNSN